MGISRIIVLSCALSAGCILANMTPTSRFQDAAYTLNDSSRWGQVDTAMKYVAPDYLDAFVTRHRDWGGPISIADADLVRMKLADDHQSAMSEVALNWYDTGGITVRNSVITQQWKAEKGKFHLVSEVVRAGDPRIFAEAEVLTPSSAPSVP